MAWVQTKNIQNLTRQLDERFPHRDRTSDGSIGDTAHQAEASGHNPDDTPGSRPAWDGDADRIQEVRAKDIDSDLGELGTDMQDVVNHLIKLPNLASVCRYLIYNRKMYHSRDGFRPTPYTGSSPHTEHLHYEGAWSDAADENDTYDFKLGDLNMPTAQEIADAVWGAAVGRDDRRRTALDMVIETYNNGKAVAAATPTLLALAKGEAAEVPPTVAAIVEGMKVAFTGHSVDQTVEVLRGILGSQAAEVGKRLAGQA